MTRGATLVPSLVVYLALVACGSDPEPEAAPVEAPPPEPTRDVSAITISSRSVELCSLLTDGSVRCWGSNYSGENGDGTTTQPSAQPSIVQGVSTAVAVAAGAFHRCAVLADGTVVCWGANDRAQLGTVGVGDSGVPLPVPGITDAVAIDACDHSTCVVTRRGTVACWGDLFRASDGPHVGFEAPVPTELPGLEGVSDVAFGGLYCSDVHALTASGEVLTWDWPTAAADGPAQLVPGPTIPGALEIDGGQFHLCARTTERHVSCWGSNVNGALGPRTPDASDSQLDDPPVVVSGLSDVVALGAGENHNCAALGDGSVWCWGEGRYGALGDGTEESSREPVQVIGVENAVELSQGGDGSCAILSDATAVCWGNVYGGRRSRLSPL